MPSMLAVLFGLLAVPGFQFPQSATSAALLEHAAALSVGHDDPTNGRRQQHGFPDLRSEWHGRT
jgi:hypothetical protein